MTIKLPPHRLACLQEILASIPRHQKCTSVGKWQQVFGKLRFMAITIPGSRGLFSLLQEALHCQFDKCLCLSRGMHDCLEDFWWLFTNLTDRPMRLYKCAAAQPGPPWYACGCSMGGVWFPVTTNLGCDGAQLHGADLAPLSATLCAPLVWPAKFPPKVIRRLVTTANLTGTITNSNLELAATIVQCNIAAHQYDIPEQTVSNGSDNISSVSWHIRLSSLLASAAPATPLLPGQGFLYSGPGQCNG